MAQLGATIFLLVILAGVAKMVFDVQVKKLKRAIENLEKYFDAN